MCMRVLFVFFIGVMRYKENILFWSCLESFFDLSLKYLICVGSLVSLYLWLFVFPSRSSDILVGFSCPFIDVLHGNIALNVQVTVSLPWPRAFLLTASFLADLIKADRFLSSLASPSHTFTRERINVSSWKAPSSRRRGTLLGLSPLGVKSSLLITLTLWGVFLKMLPHRLREERA